MRPLVDADFDANYYATGCGRPYSRDEVWLAFFGGIADRVAADLKPGRTLDVGCAWGLLVEALRARGVDAYGCDISSYAISQAHPSTRPYCWQASATDEIHGRYDLIICMEILPHLTEAAAAAALANMCRHTDAVLFSSSPADPDAPRHLNALTPEHWAGVFKREGFDRDATVDVSFVTPWAALYLRRGWLPAARRWWRRVAGRGRGLTGRGRRRPSGSRAAGIDGSATRRHSSSRPRNPPGTTARPAG